MQHPGMDKEARKRVIKEVIRRLHDGASADDMTKQFGQVLHSVSATEIAQIEQELIDEGMPRDEVLRFCDVHLAVFQESLAAGDTLAPAGHPIHTLMEEHRLMLGQAQALVQLAKEIQAAGQVGPAMAARLSQAEADILGAESHYVREENVLFPYLEKHGIVQPPAIMWMEHDQIRAAKKAVLAAIGRQAEETKVFAGQLSEAAVGLAELIAGHFYKENNILYPASMRVITDAEWPELRAEFDELGYTPFTPAMPAAAARASVMSVGAEGGSVRFGTGTLPLEALEAILNTLPVDITFVDSDDRVRYFNDMTDRVFPRAKAVLGRTVLHCHPQKSVHVVSGILDGFRKGNQEPAEFWLEMRGKFVHIRYYPVRDHSGTYLGCLEVMQDVTGIRALQGEKRLL